jgi:hypothetical protein
MTSYQKKRRTESSGKYLLSVEKKQTNKSIKQGSYQVKPFPKIKRK